MKINKNYIEGMNIGKLSEKREKILKEADLDPDKMDGFMSGHTLPTEKTSMKINLEGLKKGVKKDISFGGEDDEPAPTPEANHEVSVDFGDMKATLTRVMERFKIGSMAKKAGEISSLDMEGYMIPANEGKVAHMTLTYGLYNSVKDNYLEAMKTFISKMPSAKFTVLTTNESDRKELQGYLSRWEKENIITDKERVKVVNSEKNLSIWAQDSALVIGKNVVEQDRIGFPGSGDKYVASEVAKANPEVEYKKLDGIFIDGGNQLASSSNLFVGSDAIAFMVREMKSYPSKYNKIIQDLKIEGAEKCSKEELAKLMLDRTFPYQKVVIVGYKGKQPAFHIDMAMTPLGKADPETGKPVITVGDPSMASRILLDIRKNKPDKYKTYEKAIRQKIPSAPSHPLDTLINTVNREAGLQESFDAIAKGLEQSGYKIERVPYMGSTQTRSVPWITYNNSVIDGDNIFIPNFGIPELDGPSNKVYEKYGYTPVPVDMTAITSLQGAINCITKVIERKYSA